MTRREEYVVKSFFNCVKRGRYPKDYAITIIEDNARYGWMSDEAKEVFYEMLDELHPEPGHTLEPEP